MGWENSQMSETLNFGQRTAVITGGSKNIGLAIAKKFAAAGLQVAIVSSNPNNISAAKKEFENNSKIEGFVCDLHHVQTFDALLQDIATRMGSIDILVNCAGVLDMASIEDTQEETWDDVMAINLKASFFLTQKALPYLKVAHHPRVIHISSNAGRMGGFANGLSYSASKGGLISMTYGMARHLAKYGITVNCIAPGTIESDMSAARDKATLEQLLQRFPIGRLGQPEEVAAAALYFASTDSGFTTGAVLDVNGGLFMG
jgi:3-oxoacyl-[acyl-carrier protein] reductase